MKSAWRLFNQDGWDNKLKECIYSQKGIYGSKFYNSVYNDNLIFKASIAFEMNRALWEQDIK